MLTMPAVNPFQATRGLRSRSAPKAVSLRVCVFASRMQQASILHLWVIYLYPGPTNRSAGNLILGDGEKSPFELHALVYDGAEIDLPPGDYTFHATKGFEYEIIHTQARVTLGKEQTVTLPLKKVC